MAPSKLSIQDMQEVALEKGGKCLSSSYVDCSTKLKWQCEKGHRWKSTPTDVNRGRWCKNCACKESAKKRKLTIEEMKIIASSRGGKCLSQTYIDAITKLEWQCRKGHIWEATPAKIKSETWCKICGRENAFASRRLSIDLMHKIAAKKGGKCLSKKYINSKTRLKWQCEQGHIWQATPDSIKNGSWCQSWRAHKALQTMEAICAKATKRGMKCLSKKYINSKTPLKWQCEHGHIWQANPSGVRSYLCLECTANNNLEEMNLLAHKRRGKCLSTRYRGTAGKLMWQCANGHQWEAKPTHIKDGHWCSECSGNKRLSIEDMKKLAASRGGKCLSTTYINAFTELRWQCANGHQWEALPLSIRKDHWCGTCSSGLGERICRAFFEQLFQRQFPKIKPKWLTNQDGNVMELDGYCRSLNIAFEHQGEQHYSSNNLYATDPLYLEKRLRDDRTKKKLCEKRGILLITIPEIPIRTPIRKIKPLIKNRLHLRKITIPEGFDKRSIDLKRAYSTSGFTNQFIMLTEIAKQKGGSCLAKNYKGNHVKLEWKCGKCGYIWQATPASIKRGSWCERCGREEGTRKRKHTMEMMKAIAAARGGNCLSKQYINANTELKWECAEGHQWFKTPHSVKNSGTWCRVCKYKSKVSVDKRLHLDA